MSTRARPRISVVVVAEPDDTPDPGLARTLASLCVQVVDRGELEVVVVVVDAPASASAPASTAAVTAAAFATDLPRLQVLSDVAGTGPASARNLGLAAASGRFVTFVDAGDVLAPQRLAHLAGALETLRCDAVHAGDSRLAGPSAHDRSPVTPRGVVLDPRAELARGVVHDVRGGVFDRALGHDGLLDLSEGLGTAADLPWTWRLQLRSHGVAVVDAPGLAQRRPSRPPAPSTVVASLHRTVQVVLADRSPQPFLPHLSAVVRARCDALLAAPAPDRADRRTLRRAVRTTIATLPTTAASVQTAGRSPRRVTTETLATSSWAPA
ncbi:glycosyl transferase family 2 [Sediminihabitans luteus]|uniref:Glycosyl transferase family 2 n=1 Tax=Sediminihabitans luteus TaxID=1138585 RepID=A0A2M9CYK9_9CELL|nr:glycosyltransferase [Sediminihabitans luteus]PJJ76943.1 glycosyl transferase family 2 [Sediminihabitans luteus]GII99584.1 hypothetical protein Slu03_19620 [Sediminihabitans luteus]